MDFFKFLHDAVSGGATALGHSLPFNSSIVQWQFLAECGRVLDYLQAVNDPKRTFANNQDNQKLEVAMKLKLSEIASIAEIVGAIAVVISLIYVGFQLNDSTRAVRSATANEISTAMSAWYVNVGSSEQASRVFFDGMTNPESLSRHEMTQYIYMTHGMFLEYQAAFYLSQEGTLDLKLRESLVNTVAGVREMPGFLTYWEQRQALFEPGFRRFVDESIANGDTNTSLEQLYRKSE